MSQNPKPPPRKTVALPPDVVERVDAFRKTMNIGSENDALRRLIEAGLNLFDKPRDLFLRCATAHKNGVQIGELIGLIINDHPLVLSISLKQDMMDVVLRDGHSITLRRETGVWEFYDEGNNIQERYPDPKKPPLAAPGKSWEPPADLDDEIPF